jgi:SAM-dependent methyltransferase
VTRDDPWLAAAWSFVGRRLPPAPASVLEIGCGPRGGFVPALLAGGYDAVGIDPDAPEAPAYRRARFEDVDLAGPMDAVVACTSLHHVDDLGHVVDRVATSLVPGGTLVVVEWAWERFDEATAQWCFTRLAPRSPSAEPGWLDRHRERWTASDRSWDGYYRAWAAEAGLHTGGRILDALDARFDRSYVGEGPYFFCDLADTTEADEQAAIDAGKIQATCLRYVAVRP